MAPAVDPPEPLVTALVPFRAAAAAVPVGSITMIRDSLVAVTLTLVLALTAPASAPRPSPRMIEVAPDVRIIAHEKTRALMAGPALAFNQPGLDTQLPGYIRGLGQRIAAGEASATPPDTLRALRDARDEAHSFLLQKRQVRHTLPTTTFSDRLSITMGGRQIEIFHLGRAVTPGDALMYLPNERVLVTGDVLVNPITFALSSYPEEWVGVLAALKALPAAVIVTGHGEPLRDMRLLAATLEVFTELRARGKAARDNGLDPDQARDAIVPQIEPLMAAITGNTPALNAQFRVQLVDWYLHRVYDELAGPLSDEIASIPPG